MTSHRLSAADRVFKEQFESGEISPAVFDHRAHVRMAYVYLAGQETEVALRQIRDALRGFLSILAGAGRRSAVVGFEKGGTCVPIT